MPNHVHTVKTYNSALDFDNNESNDIAQMI